MWHTWFRDIYTLLCIWELYSLLWLNCIPLYAQSSIHLSVYCCQLVCLQLWLWTLCCDDGHTQILCHMRLRYWHDKVSFPIIAFYLPDELGIYSKPYRTKLLGLLVAHDKYLDCFLTKLDMLAVFCFVLFTNVRYILVGLPYWRGLQQLHTFWVLFSKCYL